MSTHARPPIAPTPDPSRPAAAPSPYTYDRADGIFDATGNRIARTSYGSGRGYSMKADDDDQKEATVRLLAAAPALRDALAEALACGVWIPTHGSGHDRAARARQTAANLLASLDPG